ncbi:MAG: hypothetical protein GY866_09330, partial [Proteobacteria bacterium]|nr:hypothetical protein [Pseudomonadota bacterium]
MTKEMTSRERVYATLNHEEPDRVPIDFGGTFCSSINAVAYGRLKKHLGITCPTYVRHIIAMLAATDLDDGLEIMKIMGSDVVEFPYNFWSDWKDGLPVGGPVDDTMAFPLRGGVECIIPPHPQPILRDNGDWEMEAKGIPIFRMPKDGHYFDRVFYPLSSVDNTKKLEEVMPAMANNAFFRPLKADYLDLLSRYARNIHEQTDFFVMANMHSYLSLWQFPCLDIFGYESFFMIMATDPELVHRWMEFI